LARLKKEFLELLEKDLEFRYAVAGYLGLSELLKRLDLLAEEQVKLREEQVKIWEEIANIRKEQIKLSEEQVKLREDFHATLKRIESIEQEQVKLSEEQVKLREDFKELREEQTKLRGEQVKLSEELARLREDFNKMFEAVNLRFDKVELRLNRVERTLEKLTVDIEDEARSIVKHRIKEDLGLEMEIGSLILPDVELNIYGVLDDVCVIGEATVRGSPKTMKELLEKIELLKNKYPNKLRAKLIPIIYVCLPLPELIEEAKKKNVWLLKATKDYYKPSRLK